MNLDKSRLPRPELNPLRNHPLVSIVVSSLNQGHYIEETILSVLTQDYRHIELIVVDGGSTDSTLEVLRKYEYDGRLKWVSEPDDGPNDAYNKGLYLARGEIVGLQNSSDTYQPHAIAEAISEFESNPKSALVAGSILEIDADGRHTGVGWDHPAEKMIYTLDDILSLEDYPAGQSSFFRRDIALSNGGFSPNFKWHLTFFHLDYMLEAIRLGYQPVKIPRPWGNYRRHPGMLHEALASQQVGLEVATERTRAYRNTARRFSNLLTRKQVRDLQRSGYLYEFRFRVGVLRQMIPAIPALWGFIRFGGIGNLRCLRPQKKSWVSFLTSFMLDRFVPLNFRGPRSSRAERPD